MSVGLVGLSGELSFRTWDAGDGCGGARPTVAALREDDMHKCWIALALTAAAVVPAVAAVDLVTVPRREATQLTIYNSEDITMVREHRLLTVKRGVNRIQFSWANTLIAPTSIDFRILDHQDAVEDPEIDARRIDQRIGPGELDTVDALLDRQQPMLADHRDVFGVVDGQLRGFTAGDGHQGDVGEQFARQSASQ